MQRREQKKVPFTPEHFLVRDVIARLSEAKIMWDSTWGSMDGMTKKNIEKNFGYGRAEGHEGFPGDEVGKRLKALYNSVESEPIPDRFLDLLDKLDRAEQSASRSGE